MKTTIRYARLSDYTWIQRMQRIFSNQIGFLSAAALKNYIEQKNVMIADRENIPVGYLLGRLSLSWQPDLAQVIQIAVHPDYAGAHVATQLLATLVKLSQDNKRVGVQAICREDLAANEFWKARGFKHICFLTPNNARKKALIVWRLPLASKLPLWFCQPPRRAGTHGRRPKPATRKGIPHDGYEAARWQLHCHTAGGSRKNKVPTRRNSKAKKEKTETTQTRAPMVEG